MAQDLDRSKLLRLLRQLNLPKGQYVVFGGACLVIHGLRQADDIDIFVTKKLYNQLKSSDWTEQWPKVENPPLLETIIEDTAVHAFYDWQQRKKWRPNIKKLIEQPELIEGFPFMPLELLHKWKSSLSRSKDDKDIKLIEAYWRRPPHQAT